MEGGAAFVDGRCYEFGRVDRIVGGWADEGFVVGFGNKKLLWLVGMEIWGKAMLVGD